MRRLWTGRHHESFCVHRVSCGRCLGHRALFRNHCLGGAVSNSRNKNKKRPAMEGIWASRFLALGERAPLVNFFDGSRTCLGALRRRTKQKGMMRGSHGLASAYCRQIIPPEALFQPQHNRARGLTNTNKAWGFLLSVPGLEGQDDASLPLSCPLPFLFHYSTPYCSSVLVAETDTNSKGFRDGRKSFRIGGKSVRGEGRNV